jgi:hypothetical protein
MIGLQLGVSIVQILSRLIIADLFTTSHWLSGTYQRHRRQQASNCAALTACNACFFFFQNLEAHSFDGEVVRLPSHALKFWSRMCPTFFVDEQRHLHTRKFEPQSYTSTRHFIQMHVEEVVTQYSRLA